MEKGRIKNVKFLSFGCASNIATASILTEDVKGMTIEEAKEFSWKKVVTELGGLPKQKLHCSVMAVEGLQKAIEDYEKREGKKKKKKDLKKSGLKIVKKVKKRVGTKKKKIVKKVVVKKKNKKK